MGKFITFTYKMFKNGMLFIIFKFGENSSNFYNQFDSNKICLNCPKNQRLFNGTKLRNVYQKAEQPFYNQIVLDIDRS